MWQEQQRTATAKDDFGESFRLLSLADGLTSAGWASMGHVSNTRGTARRSNASTARPSSSTIGSPRIHPSTPAYRPWPFTDWRSPAWSRDRACPRRTTTAARSPSMRACSPPSPEDDELRDGLADTYYNLGLPADRTPPAGSSKAEPSFRRRSSSRRSERSNPDNPDLLEQVAGHRLQFAKYLEERRKPAEAERERRAVDRSLRAADRLRSTPGDQSALWAATHVPRSSPGVMARHRIRPGSRNRPSAEGWRSSPTIPDCSRASPVSSRSGRTPTPAPGRSRRAGEEGGRCRAGVHPSTWRVLALAHLHAHDLPVGHRGRRASP